MREKIGKITAGLMVFNLATAGMALIPACPAEIGVGGMLLGVYFVARGIAAR
jgi:hypothetical protein